MNITTQPPVLSSVCLVESRHDWHWDTLVGGLFMRKRETNLTLEFTREVVAGAQMLIAAKYSQLRSGKSVRESRAALKRCFFLWAGRREHTWNMKYCYSWAESSPLSFTTLRLPNAFFFVWASNETCAERASFLLLVGFPERPTVSAYRLMTVTAAARRTWTNCPLLMSFCSPWQQLLLLLLHINVMRFVPLHGARVAVEQAWSAQKYWPTLDLGKG